MLAAKGMRFPSDIILVCIRWYAAYPLSYRHLEEMMEERGVFVDHSSINRWAIRFRSCRNRAPLPQRSTNRQSLAEAHSPLSRQAPAWRSAGTSCNYPGSPR
jgi:transposase-like protein